MTWQQMTRQERAKMVLGDILPESAWPAVISEWIQESYEDTPDGEKRALNDLIHIAQRTMRKPTKLSEVRSVLRANQPED